MITVIQIVARRRRAISDTAAFMGSRHKAGNDDPFGVYAASFGAGPT